MARGPETRLVYSTGGEREEERLAPPRSGGPIRVRLERRASDRVVTLVTGLPGSKAEVAALLRALKSACGTGGTVKHGILELQGDQRTPVEAFLAGRGFKARAGRG
jgi:translation initiation factor 1